MRGWIQSFLLMLSTASDKELARMVEYLQEENRILRSKLLQRITVTPQERRRLVRLGKKLGRVRVGSPDPSVSHRGVAGRKLSVAGCEAFSHVAVTVCGTHFRVFAPIVLHPVEDDGGEHTKVRRRTGRGTVR